MFPFKKSIEFFMSLMSDDYNQVGKTSLELRSLLAITQKVLAAAYTYTDVLKFIDWIGIKI